MTRCHRTSTASTTLVQQAVKELIVRKKQSVYERADCAVGAQPQGSHAHGSNSKRLALGTWRLCKRSDLPLPPCAACCRVSRPIRPRPPRVVQGATCDNKFIYKDAGLGRVSRNVRWHSADCATNVNHNQISAEPNEQKVTCNRVKPGYRPSANSIRKRSERRSCGSARHPSQRRS